MGLFRKEKLRLVDIIAFFLTNFYKNRHLDLSLIDSDGLLQEEMKSQIVFELHYFKLAVLNYLLIEKCLNKILKCEPRDLARLFAHSIKLTFSQMDISVEKLKKEIEIISNKIEFFGEKIEDFDEQKIAQNGIVFALCSVFTEIFVPLEKCVSNLAEDFYNRDEMNKYLIVFDISKQTSKPIQQALDMAFRKSKIIYDI